MKNTFLLLMALSLSLPALAQKPAACCHAPKANGKPMQLDALARLGSNKKFQAAHDAPLPYIYKGTGTEVSFPTTDGKPGKAFEVKAAKPTNKYLIVVHEWWGLNDNIKREAAEFSKELGVNVLAVDLYDGLIATTPEEAGKATQTTKPERAIAILKGAETFAGAKAEIATLGWCFGGGFSLQAALAGGKQIVGCVMYYGAPEKEVAKLKTLHSDVLFVFAQKDQWINKPMVDQFTKDMAEAGKGLTVKAYDADHAFANPSNPHFNKEYADAARAETLKYLKERFKI